MKRPALIPVVLTSLMTATLLDAVPPRIPGLDNAKGDTSVREARARLLSPEVFARLSPGGKRAALLVNGLPGSATSPRRKETFSAVLDAAPDARQNVRVNDPSMDEIGHTNSQSSIAVQGSRIVIGFNDAALEASGYVFSTDGGATFTHRRLTPGTSQTAGDPVVAFGPAGEVYYATLLGDLAGYSSIGLAKSTDGGSTFRAPVDVAEGIFSPYEFHDKPWLAVDTSASSPRKGWVYLSWTTFFEGSYPAIMFCRSRDGGKTFELFTGLSPLDGGVVQNSAMAVAPNGDLYLAYEDAHLSPAGIAILKSTDGGASWRGPKALTTFEPLRFLTGGGGVAADSYPAMTIDGKGVLHIVWAAPSSGTLTDRSDIFYVRSTDAGGSFSAIRKLNDDGTSTTQAFPAIAATPDGRVAVTWSDRRNDPANDGLNDRYMVISPDSGATFGKSFRITDQNWIYGPIENRLAGGYHGAYDGIASDGGNFYLAWSDERGTDPDVYFTVVPSTFAGDGADFGVSTREPFATVKAGNAVSVEIASWGLNGFNGTLSLSATSAGAGLSYSFAKSSINAGETVRLMISVSPFTTAGDYPITVTASSGASVRKTTIRFRVLEASRTVGPPVNVTRTPGFTFGAGVVRDPSGTLHLLYEDDSAAVLGQDVFYQRSTDGGSTFSGRRKLNEASSIATDSVLAADGSGRVLAVWTSLKEGETTSRVIVARSTDGGVTFSAPVAVTPSSQDARFPAVALDGAGNAVIAYYEVGKSPSTLQTVRSTDGGATFASPSALSDPDASQLSRPGLAFDSKGTAFLVYTAQTVSGGIIRSAIRLASAARGQNFGTPVPVSAASVANAIGPDIAVGPDDSLAIAYYVRIEVEPLVTNREIFFTRSTDSGKTFTTAVNVSNNAGQSFFPAVTVEPSGAITVVWEDTSDNGQTDVFLRRSTDGGRTFSSPLNLSSTPGLSGSSANLVSPVSIGGSGRVRVVPGAAGSLLVSWADDSPGNPDIFLSSVGIAELINLPPAVAITSPSSGQTFEAGVPVVFRASATDPEGGPLAIRWDFGDGTTQQDLAPAAHPFARPGTYPVILVVSDSLGAMATARVDVIVTTPTSAGSSFLLPVVLDATGEGGSHYTTEVTLTSRASVPTTALLSYTASAGGGSGVARISLGAGETRVVNGIISFLRGQNLPIPDDGQAKAGTLAVTFDGVNDPSLVNVVARTFTPDPAGGSGTFGLSYGAAATADQSLAIFGLQQTSALRSNLGLVNAGRDSITLQVRFEGPAGESLGDPVSATLGPFEWTQLLQPLVGKSESGRAVVTRVSGLSPFSAYGVLNDSRTSDGSFVPPLLASSGDSGDRLIPIVLDAQGTTSRYRTELTLTNFSSSPLSLTLVYRAAEGFGSGSGSVPLTLAAGEQRVLPDAVGFLRTSLPIEADGRSVGGSLLIRTSDGTAASAFAAGARTFAQASPAGTYGLFYTGLTLAESADTTCYVYGLQENARQRSNVAIVNRGDQGDSITLRISYFDGSGAPAGTSFERTLSPGEWYQFTRPLANLGASSGYAKVERTSGRSRFVAYGVLNDNTTSDGSYLAMTR